MRRRQRTWPAGGAEAIEQNKCGGPSGLVRGEVVKGGGARVDDLDRVRSACASSTEQMKDETSLG